MGRFNNLDVPYQWKDYFTKYPHGYTIWEALCNWTKQVDDLVDAVNNYDDYFRDFVETFEFELQNEVVATLQEWENDGKLDDILELALGQPIIEIQNEIETFKNEVSARISDIEINVKDFGAVGNGSIDDTASIQSALDSFDDYGGTLYFPKGVYLVTSPLVFPHLSTDSTRIKRIHIKGKEQGRGWSAVSQSIRSQVTFDYQGDSGALFDLRNGDESYTHADVNFSGFMAVGKSLNTATGINGYNLVGSVFEDLTFNGFYNGMKVEQYFYYSTIDRCSFAYSANEALSFRLINGAVISNSNFKGNSTGIRFYYSGHPVNIQNCYFENNSEYAITSNNTVQLNIFNSYFEANGADTGSDIYIVGRDAEGQVTLLNLTGCYFMLLATSDSAVKFYKDLHIIAVSNVVHTTNEDALFVKRIGGSTLDASVNGFVALAEKIPFTNLPVNSEFNSTSEYNTIRAPLIRGRIRTNNAQIGDVTEKNKAYKMPIYDENDTFLGEIQIYN